MNHKYVAALVARIMHEWEAAEDKTPESMEVVIESVVYEFYAVLKTSEMNFQQVVFWNQALWSAIHEKGLFPGFAFKDQLFITGFGEAARQYLEKQEREAAQLDSGAAGVMTDATKAMKEMQNERPPRKRTVH